MCYEYMFAVQLWLADRSVEHIVDGRQLCFREQDIETFMGCKLTKTYFSAPWQFIRY